MMKKEQEIEQIVSTNKSIAFKDADCLGSNLCTNDGKRIRNGTNFFSTNKSIEFKDADCLGSNPCTNDENKNIHKQMANLS